ncbi:MAG: hypothetical protein H7833_18850 [Magnetococcus sp. DMHC-1]|nr:hypothetical protein [Magnetococcales bacterium]
MLGVGDLLAHGPGSRLELHVEFCAETTAGRIHVPLEKQTSGDYPFCLDIRNPETVDISLSLSLIPGLINDQGKSVCVMASKPDKGTTWLSTKDETGIFRVVVPAGTTGQHKLVMHMTGLTDYPADVSGNKAFRGWLGCVLVEGRAVAEENKSRHKGTRIMRMLRAVAE